MLGTWCGHRMHVFPMTITVSKLLSLLQLIKRFKLHVVKTETNAILMGNID